MPAEDITDDWMNPGTTVWTPPQVENMTVYLIKRAKRVIVTGNRGSFVTWQTWDEFKTRELRDKELDRLRAAHPAWKLVASDYNPYLDLIQGLS